MIINAEKTFSKKERIILMIIKENEYRYRQVRHVLWWCWGGVTWTSHLSMKRCELDVSFMFITPAAESGASAMKQYPPPPHLHACFPCSVSSQRRVCDKEINALSSCYQNDPLLPFFRHCLKNKTAFYLSRLRFSKHVFFSRFCWDCIEVFKFDETFCSAALIKQK